MVYLELDRSPDFSTAFNFTTTEIYQDSAHWRPTSANDYARIADILKENGQYFWRASSDGINWENFSFELQLASYAYPVPFRKSEGHSRITFTDLPQDSRIIVATVSGAIAFEKSGVGPEDWIWDVRNDKGRELVSGVYLYAVDSPGGISRGKIVVIR
jgi:hypothetical protein